MEQLSHVHDYVSHADANGLTYFTDGGLDYARRSSSPEHPYTNLSIYDNVDFEIIRESFHWVVKKNDLYLWVKLSELDTELLNDVYPR